MNWLQEVNHERPSRATAEVPELRRQQELPRLRPLRVTPERLALRVPIQVSVTAEVSYDGRSYAMPPEAASMAGTLGGGVRQAWAPLSAAWFRDIEVLHHLLQQHGPKTLDRAFQAAVGAHTCHRGIRSAAAPAQPGQHPPPLAGNGETRPAA